ncbi:MBL fold metallo-hydrolase [Pseudofrankia asymbiotica]|uniref:MBL fold metallo-hydrolase n=1 Tax=Pseudofrankia asymbiotica TaxID=1834516 RepID=UPI0009D71D5F|nr:MBL fold metallo-hydrolase [Pseudofrankia asymbiotica]
MTRIDEAEHRLPIDQFIPAADADVRRRHAGRLSAAQLDDAGTMTLVIGAFVIESRGRRILVDTCVGPEHQHGDPASPFLRRLAEAGFPPESIDVVVCTHVHFDHVGWNTRLVDGERVPTFPRAQYVFGEQEWNAVRDADLSTSLLASVERDVTWVIGAGRATLAAADHRLTDEVSLLPTFGHSPGHVSVLIRSAGQQAVITGDAAHHPLQLLQAELATVADGDAAQAVTSRLALIDRAVDTGAILFGTHFAEPSAVRIRADGDGLALEPVEPTVAGHA